MKTIEFKILPGRRITDYKVKYTPRLAGVEEMQSGDFNILLLDTIVLLSENNPAREPIEVHLPKNFATEYNKRAKTIFLHYAGHKGVAVLYPNDAGKPERLWENV
ncbi:MAG: hypothetical protein AABX07_01640 [Nanoarchaeota archaeon]